MMEVPSTQDRLHESITISGSSLRTVMTACEAIDHSITDHLYRRWLCITGRERFVPGNK